MAELGKHVWYDLMTPDPAGAIAFYGEVFGWTTQSWDKGDYTMWGVGQEQWGGLMALPQAAQDAGAPPHWIGYVNVADINATVAKCEALGGKIMVPPTPISEGTFFAIMLDLEGATFAAYSSSNPSDAGWDPPGPFQWAELNANDWTAASKFYMDLFGWTETSSMSMDGSGSAESTYWMFGVNAEKSMGGMANTAPMMGGHPFWLHYATVTDLDDAIERVKANGGKILNGPMPVPGGDRIVQCMDPQGGAFAMYEEGTGGA